jgi:hypothetical protein
MNSLVIFFTFNGIGLLLSLATMAVIAYSVVSLEGIMRKGLISLLKGFTLIPLSFIWTLFFGKMIAPSQILNIQSVLLSFGMAMMVYSARQVYEIYEHNKSQINQKK